MKKNSYMQDITDILGDDTSSQEALNIAKKIKSSQKKAFPSIEFKQHLSDRLSNINLMRELDDEKPRFSLLQIFGAFASFIFISGGALLMYQMSSVPQIIEQQDTFVLPIEELQINHEGNSRSSEIKPKTNPRMMGSMGEENLDTSRPAEISNDARTDPASSIMIMEIPQDTPDGSQSNFLPNEIVESDLFDSNSEMMIYEDSQGIYEYQSEEFLRICGELQGTVSDDQYECILPNDKVCNIDNIFEYSESPCEAIYGENDSSNESGELIEEQGQ